GGGALSASTSTTDNDGLSSVKWTLSSTVGTQVVTVTSSQIGGASVSFVAGQRPTNNGTVASIPLQPLAPPLPPAPPPPPPLHPRPAGGVRGRDTGPPPRRARTGSWSVSKAPPWDWPPPARCRIARCPSREPRAHD